MRAGRRGQEARKLVQELSGPGLWTCGRVWTCLCASYRSSARSANVSASLHLFPSAGHSDPLTRNMVSACRALAGTSGHPHKYGYNGPWAKFSRLCLVSVAAPQRSLVAQLQDTDPQLGGPILTPSRPGLSGVADAGLTIGSSLGDQPPIESSWWEKTHGGFVPVIF